MPVVGVGGVYQIMSLEVARQALHLDAVADIIAALAACKFCLSVNEQTRSAEAAKELSVIQFAAAVAQAAPRIHGMPLPQVAE